MPAGIGIACGLYFLAGGNVSDLKAQVAARFVAVNGEHPMTSADDAYVAALFVPLSELCAEWFVPADVLRQSMLDGQLPLPSYLMSDGSEMVPADLLELSEQAGGIEKLEDWFLSQWTDGQEAAGEWQGYLSGQNVCLRTITPDTLKRKNYLVEAISRATAEPQESQGWLADLHRLVDELDEIELPFTRYDRLRFGGPVSRDTLIDAVRDSFPRP